MDSPSNPRNCGWRFCAARLFLGLVIAIGVGIPSRGRGEEFGSTEPPLLASSAERLMMEQIEELVEAGEHSEAIANLERLFDQGLGAIVEAGDVQKAGTLHALRYVPLRDWTQQRLAQLLAEQPEVNVHYQARVAEIAQAVFDEVRASHSPTRVRRAAERFYASQVGPQLSLLLSDLYLERGWSLAGIQAAQRAASDLRVIVGSTERQGSVAWSLIWQQVRSAQQRQRYAEDLRELSAQSHVSGQTRGELLSQAARRVALAASLEPEIVDQPATHRWAQFIAEALDGQDTAALTDLLKDSQDWPKPLPDRSRWLTLGGSAARNRTHSAKYGVQQWPTWSRSLERFTATSDRTPASKPRVGEVERGTLPYFPVIAGGRVFVHGLNRIVAFDLETGRPWPDIQPALPLFDSQISAAAFLPLGYPLVGSPRGTLVVDENYLYARMGSPVTGWANREGAADGGSLSYLVGLDWKRQGSLLRGFPLRLAPPEDTGAEFEGAPLVWGDLLLVAIVERDNVGLRRSVAAFDRFSGELRWRSGELAAGNVEGSERANLISHQLLSMAGGRLYYNTNLGAIVCLDPLTGRVEWLTRYSRPNRQKQLHPTPDRFRYRDLTPCLISGGLVYCAPQDCPEIFALDATTGDLVWSTDDTQVADAIHLLGVSDNCLLVSGDRLVWLHRQTGKVLGRFPGTNTPGMVTALPSPRGLGRGLISAQEVYWPTAGEIFVFPTTLSELPESGKLSGGVPPILRRLRLDSRGREGGNLIANDRWLLVASPSRILAFKQDPSPVDTISFVPATVGCLLGVQLNPRWIFGNRDSMRENRMRLS